jgi:hypothetical protein
MTKRKGVIGSTALAVGTTVADLAGAAASFVFGAMVAPWGWAVLKFAGAWFLARLRHDFPLFLLLILLLIVVLGVAIRFVGDNRPSPERRKVAWENLGVLSLAFMVIWLGAEVVTGFHWLVTLGFVPVLQPGAFPAMLLSVLHPQWPFGFGWLAYYLLAHFWRRLLDGPAPQVKGKSAKKLPLARPISEGPRETHIKRCYQHFRDVSQAWDPPPIKRLKLPAFCYYEGSGPLLWKGRTLIIPETLLDPARTEDLLPALARKIARYNGPDLWLHGLMDLYPRRFSLLLTMTGNFIWLPWLVKHKRWSRWQGERILEIDHFVHWLGQSPALLHQLRQRRYKNQQEGVVDTSWPTLLERIDQLEMLIGKEQLQMKNQGITPKEPPMVADQQATPLRIQSGTAR